jgi:uracil-DNA glycosylase
MTEAPTSLGALRKAEAACMRCPLYRDATQVVPGEGPIRAQFMMVGEQPGDQEGLAGRPFVGPAGRVLDRAIAEAGIKPSGDLQRGEAFQIRVARQAAVAQDAERIRDRPLPLERPGATDCASRARDCAGRHCGSQPDGADRHDLQDTRFGFGRTQHAAPRHHPSYLLRIKDEAAKTREYEHFVSDLKACVATFGPGCHETKQA